MKANELGLVLPKEMEFEDWAFIGRRLGNVRNASNWWFADWVADGYPTYGVLANEAAEQFGLDAGRVPKYRRVAERIEKPRRRGTVSFEHHLEVASMEDEAEQECLLDAAEAHLSDDQPVMSVKELRASIRARATPALDGRRRLRPAGGGRFNRMGFRGQFLVRLGQNCHSPGADTTNADMPAMISTEAWLADPDPAADEFDSESM